MPIPPTPVRVNSRACGNSRLISTSSRSRPTNEVIGSGKFEFLPSAPRASFARELGDGPDKPIPPSAQRLDPAFASGGLGKSSPDHRNLDGEIGLLDDQVRPRRIDDASLLNILVGATDEGGEDRDRAGAQSLWNPASGQHPGRRVKPEGPEFINAVHAKVLPSTLPSGRTTTHGGRRRRANQSE